MPGDRHSESLALLGVRDGRFEGRPGHPDATGRDVDPAQLERPQDLRQALPQFGIRPTEDGSGGYAMVPVDHLHRLDAPVPQLVDMAGHLDPAEGRPGVLLDDKAGDPFGRARRERHHPGSQTVGDPHLGAVDDVLVPIRYGAALHGPRVAAGVGLRQRQGAAPLPARHLGQQAVALLVVTVQPEEGGRDHVGVEHPGERHPSGSQLLDDPCVSDHVQPQSSVRLRNEGPEETERGKLLDKLFRIGVGVLEVRGDGHDVPSYETANCFDQLVRGRGVNPRHGHRGY